MNSRRIGSGFDSPVARPIVTNIGVRRTYNAVPIANVHRGDVLAQAARTATMIDARES